MNKQEAIEFVKNTSYSIPITASVKYLREETVVDLISQIDEPQKVVIPKCVTEWLKEYRYANTLLKVLNAAEDERIVPSVVNDWILDNQRDFVVAWYDGYEIEKEKLYTVEIPDPNADGYSIVLGRKEGKVLIKQVWSTTWEMNCSNQLTEAEIKQDFEWAWQFAEEVE